LSELSDFKFNEVGEERGINKSHVNRIGVKTSLCKCN